MANILISACQKLPESANKTLARKDLLPFIPSRYIGLLALISDSLVSTHEVRADCIQVLVSTMYHLKSTLLPFASYLLKLALRFLEQGSVKIPEYTSHRNDETLAGAKLMASLMASEDQLSDPSQNVREVCDKLLACITLRNIFSEKYPMIAVK
ncbi:hypothetical protein IGI04_014343 [Brassica rapa subsp. trilocularis]|uniref:Pre-rRNA-processing protein RIX1 N-terminal domain-containing protein n=1 Tax=Brassica rapa subsp. trilocularis TaxID=1813537 RepID=A0ABQ7MLY3_BRACM|nr:hypothetical protein IGI04_014343 [Brassica rapa subsp. trilocularis]